MYYPGLEFELKEKLLIITNSVTLIIYKQFLNSKICLNLPSQKI